MLKQLSGAALLSLAGAGLAGRMMQRQKAGSVDLPVQVALVTGSSRGLGFLLARELGREGCRVVICARDKAELERARADLAAEGIEVLALPCDVGAREQVERLIDEATRRFGPVELLVNNAGVIQVGPLQSLTLEDFEEAMGVMFWGVVYPTRAVLPQMLARRAGRIVNITAIGGRIGVPHLPPYVCAKYAAIGFSETLHAELASQGITVTTLVPGLMRTGSHLNALFKGKQQSEFTWFSLGATLPLISMDAERAARQIVASIKAGEVERTLSIPATLIARFHGLFPGLTATLAGLVAPLLLPTPDADTRAMRDMEVQERLEAPRRQALDLLTTLGQRAARRLAYRPIGVAVTMAPGASREERPSRAAPL